MGHNLSNINNYQTFYRGIVTADHQVKVFSNKTALTIDSSIDFDIESGKRSSLDAFSTSILSDILLAIMNYAQKRQVDFDNLEGKIDLNLYSPLTLLMVKGYDEPAKISKITVTVYLYLDVESEEAFQSFIDKALNYALLYNSLKNLELIKVIVKQVL